MSCSDKCCGTGLDGINNPKPGDPDNNVSLSANTVYGGISVSWSFPTTNPQAVAHTILYRGVNNDFTKAVELVRVGGSIYFDALNPTTDTTYYYWIRFLTVNGTLLDKVGPVSATAKVRGPQTLESLTGLIDSSVLAQELKSSIAGITLQGQALLKEIEDRLAANTELSALLALVQSGQQDSMTYVQQEITQRTTADSAIVESINLMAAAVEQNAAAILTETQVRVDKDTAMASQITTLFSQSSGYASAIQSEASTRANADSALATTITTLTTRVGNAESTISDEARTRSSDDAALSSRITTAESSLFGNVATGQVALQTQITSQNGKITSIGSLYTAKVQVNGLIGGFGVYNDGTLVDAGFDVDRFWIGRTGPDKVKPFIIDSGIVYIDKARIRNADIDTLKIAGNAVTVPASVSGYGGASGVNTGSNVYIGQVSIYMPQYGSAVLIANWQSSLGNQGANSCMRIYDNGSQVASWSDSGIANYRTSHVGTARIDLYPGWHTFTIYVFNDYGGTWDLQNWGVTVLGVMR